LEFVLTVDIFGDFVYIYSMSLTLTMPGTEQKHARSIALHIIREIFTRRKIKIEKIIIFGSRARGDFNKDSDWDFLVIADKEIAIKEKHRLITQIKRKLAKLGIPNDIIIQSMSKFESMKNFPGNISYVANFEGVTV
jgi:predicted nucleotidyltransferase